MDVIHLERPLGDRELNETLWASADEEQLEISVRQKLALQGFRVAVLGGTMPAVLKTLFSEEELGQMNGEHLMIQAGVPTQVQTSGMVASWPAQTASTEEGQNVTMSNAFGSLRVLPRITADGCIDLAITPEIQFGDARRQFLAGTGVSGSQDWSIQVGRSSRVLGELSFSVRVRSGQFVLLSCFASQPDSLAARFFSRQKDGQTMQRVVLIDAEPSREAIAARLATR